MSRFGEMNANDQIESWGTRLMDEDTPRIFPTAAACLGAAVASIIAMVERETSDQS